MWGVHVTVCGQRNALSVDYHLSSCLRQGLLSSIIRVRLAALKASGKSRVPPPEHLSYSHMLPWPALPGFRELNSGSRDCKTNALPTESSRQTICVFPKD